MSQILVTGGAGFIGANFVMDWLREQSADGVVSVDKLTYAGSLANLAPVRDDTRHVFVRADICDRTAMDQLFARYRPRAVVHFAAESHVDRSIHGASEFVQTNVAGTVTLLEAACSYWRTLDPVARAGFRFLHISTDEVFGSLGPGDPPFTEQSPYRPNSPYSASKAASDHFVRASHRTYGLPALTIHCTNNYGPYQFPEKLIPLTISNALAGKALPLYGDGLNVRDWLYVSDHCVAIRALLERGRIGECYNVGSRSEKTNIEVVTALCDLLDELSPSGTGSYREQIAYIADRPGHDRRYAMDAHKLECELGWAPAETFATGLRKTVRWYLDNQAWVSAAMTGESQDWMGRHYAI